MSTQRITGTLLLATAMVLLVGAPAADAAGVQGRGSSAAGTQLRYKGKTYPLTEPPAELGDAALAALASWAPLAESEGWSFALDRDVRVLLVTPSKVTSKVVDRHLALIERVGKDVDALLPLPERSAEPEPPPATGGGAPRRDPDVIPEDPEESPPEPIGGPGGAWFTTWTWGLDERVLERDIAVLFVLPDESHVDPVLKRLEELQPYLASWLPGARELAGWVLEKPLAGLCYEWPSGVEEWNLENEIVHRTTELLVLRRFGPLPNWLVQGFAWTVEFRIQKTIYCFPGRAEFVWATEHTSWPHDVARRFSGRNADPLEMKELTRLRPNHYDNAAAPLSWGLVDYLARTDPKKLSALAEDLRLDYDENSRIDHGDGTWSREPLYETPEPRQHELLLEHFGPKVLETFQRQAGRGR